MSRHGKLTLWLIGAWFLVSLMGSALGLFRNSTQRFGSAIAIAAAAPILLFAVWSAASPSFRAFVMSLNPRALTALQTWRIIGFVFVLLQAYRLLPAMFAYPAGFGDILIGATASLVAWQLGTPRYRNAFMAWQVLGIADLLVAVGTGTLSGVLEPSGISMMPMTVLPLSLVPTFLVPLFLVFHMICIAQAWKWRPDAAKASHASRPIAHPVG
jgi:hypothetical protein